MVVGAISVFGIDSIKEVQLVNRLVEQVKEEKKGQGQVEAELLNKVVEKIEHREEVSNNKFTFIKGYNNYIQGDMEKAKINFRKAYEMKNDSIRLYSTVFLVEMLFQEQALTEEAAQEILKMVTELLQTTNVELYNEEYELLSGLMQKVIHIENGKALTIEAIEVVLKEANKLEAEVVCDLKNKMAVLYFHNGNYARAMERLLEVMAHNETMENKYYGAKAQIDLGIIYRALGNYEEARKSFENVLTITLADEEKQAFIKTYAATNLYENILYEEDYEQLQAVNKIIKMYENNLPENLYGSINIMNDIFLCNYYIHLKDLTAAEVVLKGIETKLKRPEEYAYLSVQTNYMLLKADLADLKGNKEEAINIYKILLEEDDKQLKKYTLRKISQLLKDYNQYKEASGYEEQLREYYEEDAMATNMDYSEYALYKYESEKKLIEETNNKIRQYIYIMLVGVGIAGGLILCYIKYTKLINMNKLDGLTKSYNRRYFEEYYKGIQQKDCLFTLLMMDIDHFKTINDTYGHLVGDKVIKKVVELSKMVLGDKGKFFRYGGEEFVIILEGLHKIEGVQLAEKIRETIQDYLWQDALNVTVSIGIKEATPMIKDILNGADQNLYKAKAQGRNQIVYK